MSMILNECFFSAFVYVSKRKQEIWNIGMKKRFLTLNNNSVNLILWNSELKDTIVDSINIISSVFVIEYEDLQPILRIRLPNNTTYFLKSVCDEQHQMLNILIEILHIQRKLFLNCDSSLQRQLRPFKGYLEWADSSTKNEGFAYNNTAEDKILLELNKNPTRTKQIEDNQINCNTFVDRRLSQSLSDLRLLDYDYCRMKSISENDLSRDIEEVESLFRALEEKIRKREDNHFINRTKSLRMYLEKSAEAEKDKSKKSIFYVAVNTNCDDSKYSKSEKLERILNYQTRYIQLLVEAVKEKDNRFRQHIEKEHESFKFLQKVVKDLSQECNDLKDINAAFKKQINLLNEEIISIQNLREHESKSNENFRKAQLQMEPRIEKLKSLYIEMMRNIGNANDRSKFLFFIFFFLIYFINCHNFFVFLFVC
ncbi:DgyrCDS986 [Dimorphilus gyrociliatus]|uniref:DgyrCDS986 n=1 Tax=Dimorphilus gyrociliatus TaxID=2664684 RepID=A0A7I8V8S7_9ANNE|nr:DgyrCDS986 [Dimorphilus gyrociliatus]